MKLCGRVSFSYSVTSEPTSTLTEFSLDITFAELKRINDWPTFPQIIVEGELIGGLDIVKEM